MTLNPLRDRLSHIRPTHSGTVVLDKEKDREIIAQLYAPPTQQHPIQYDSGHRMGIILNVAEGVENIELQVLHLPDENPSVIRVVLDNEGHVRYFPFYESLQDSTKVSVPAPYAFQLMRELPAEVAIPDQQDKQSHWEGSLDLHRV